VTVAFVVEASDSEHVPWTEYSGAKGALAKETFEVSVHINETVSGRSCSVEDEVDVSVKFIAQYCACSAR
jgi:hypothetical protein